MTQEALKLARRALTNAIAVRNGESGTEFISPLEENALTAIEEALAQPEQEPVGRFAKFTDGIWRPVTDYSAGVPLYTTPPQRTWVGLNKEEAFELQKKYEGKPSGLSAAVENLLREKNNGQKESL